MPYNGSGTFVPDPTAYPVVSGTTVSSSKFNTTVQDLANGLSGAMTRDGQGAATAAMNMGNQKITTVANGTAATDAATVGQLTDKVSKTDNAASQSIVSNFGIGNNAGNRASLDIGTANATLIDRDIRLGYNANFYGYRLVNTNNATNTAAGLFKIQRGTSLAWADVVTIDDRSNVSVAGNVSVTGTITGSNIGGAGLYGGTWQNMTSFRPNINTTYTNSTGSPITVQLSVYVYDSIQFVIDGVQHCFAIGNNGLSPSRPFIVACIVPAGSTYKVQFIGTPVRSYSGPSDWYDSAIGMLWNELR